MSKLIFKAIPANATSAAAEQTLGYIDTTGSTQRVSVKAQPKTVYRLVDAKTGEVIKNQTVVRKGKKLQVMVDNLNVVEVDNFFPDEASNAKASVDSPSYLVDTGAAGTPSYGVVTAQTPVEVSANGMSVLWTPGMPAMPMAEPVAFGGPVLSALSGLGGTWGVVGAVGLAAAVGGGGGGGGTETGSKAAGPKVSGSVFAGPVVGQGLVAGLKVQAFDDKGNSLGTADVKADGTYELELNNSSYKGALVIKVYDDPTDNITPKYVDEATGQEKTFDTPLLAVVNYTGDAKTAQTVNVTPLTNVAALVAGVSASTDNTKITVPVSLTTSEITKANIQVAQKFGLPVDDLTSAKVVTSDKDTVNEYGKALALLSQMEKSNGKDTASVATIIKDAVKGTNSFDFTTLMSTVNSDTKVSIKNVSKNDLKSITDVDTTAPTFISANTNSDGTKIYLHFNSALSKNTADMSQFSVSVTPPGGNAANAVIDSVAIDGDDVVLTLKTKIANDQTVTVNYTDPTTGTDDLLAVQDLAGNDVTTFVSAKSVTNNVTTVVAEITVNPSQSFSYDENQTAPGGFDARVLTNRSVSKFRFADTQTSISKDGWYSIDNTGKISLTSAGLGAGKASNDFETKINGGNSLVYGVQAGDNMGNWSIAAEVTLKLTNVNDAPTVSAPAAFAVNEDTAGNLQFTGIPFVDVDSTNLTVTLSIADGSINATTGGNVNVAGTAIARTFTGTAADLNTFFTTAGKITYTGAQHANGTRTLTTSVSDGSLSNVTPSTTTITINAVNDEPSGADKTFTVMEDGRQILLATDFGFADTTDNSANSLSAVIITSLPAAGSLKLNNVDVTKDQSIAAADLSNLVYAPAPNGNGTSYATIEFKVQDDGGTANGGVNTSDAKTLTFNVTSVNDKPTLNATAANPTFTEGTAGAGDSQSVQGDGVIVFSAANISTVESGQTITSLTFTVSGLVDGEHEKIIIDGVSIQLESDDGDIKDGLYYEVSITNRVATVVITMDDGNGMSASEAQALIQSIKYQNTSRDNPTAGNRVFTLTQIKDSGGTDDSGVDTSVLNLVSTVTVNAVNDAPVNSMPDPIDVEADITSYVISAGVEIRLPKSNLPLSGLSIDDVDANQSQMSVTFSVDHGTLTHTIDSDLEFTSTDKRLTVTGTRNDLNNWLESDGLSYTPDVDYTGEDTLTMLTSDGGHSGSGGELTDTDTVTLTVADNTPPLLLKLETDEADGSIVYLTYSEALDEDNKPVPSDFSLVVTNPGDDGDEEVVVSVDSVSITDRVITLTLSQKLQVQQTVTLAYNKAGSESSGGEGGEPAAVVQDLKGNDADSFDVTGVDIKVPDVDAPVVTPNQYLRFDENQVAGAVVGTVAATDNVKVTGYRFLDNGSLSDTTANGYFKIDNDGKITITDTGARSSFNDYESEGSSGSYEVKALDAKGNVSDVGEVGLTVQDVNEIPVAQSFALLPDTVEDTAIEFLGSALNAAANDPEGSLLKFQISGVTSGTLKKWDVDGGDWLDVVVGVTVVEQADRLQWTPAADVNGINTSQINAFTVKALDGDDFTTIDIPIKVVISAVNDAPTVVSGKQVVTLTAVDEDTASPSGATVSSLFGASFSDAKDQVSGGSSANTFSGIAITGNAATDAQGVWQWSADGTSGWTAIPNNSAGADAAPTDTNVYYVRADAFMRFAPAINFNGTPGKLTTHLVDSSVPDIDNADNGDRVENPPAEHFTAAAVTLQTSVTSVNDAPTGTDKTITINEDGSKSFTAADFGFADANDNPVNAFTAVIITTLPTAGTLKLNDTDVLQNASIPVADLGNLVYTPGADANGTNYATIGFKVKDDGGGTDTSTSAKTLTINVTAVNDKPTVVAGQETVTLSAILEDAATNNGATVGSLFSASFSDAKDAVTGGSSANAFAGIGITNVASTAAQGSWQYFYNGTWSDIPVSGVDVPSPTNVFYFDVNTLLRFKPAAEFNGTPGGITAYLIENNSSGLTRFTSVNNDYFSATPVTLSTSVTAVNDAPVNTVPSAVSVAANMATYNLAGTQVAYTPQAITGLSVSDVDAGSGGMRLTLSVTNGSLAHNTSAGVLFTDTSSSSFTALGSQANLIAWLASTGGVSYTPTEGFKGNGTLTMLTDDDGFSGSGGAKTDADTVTLDVSDTRAPVLLKAETSTDGQSIVLTYDEALDSTNKSTDSQYSLTVTDRASPVTVTVTGVTASGRTVTLGLSQAIQIQQVVKLNYTDPSSDTTATVQDAQGNDSATLTNQAVTIKVPDLEKPVVTAGQSFNYTEFQSMGDLVATVLAEDNVRVTGYKFAQPNSEFDIDNNGKITISANGVLEGVPTNNFETSPNSFTYAVQAYDGTNWSVPVDITLNVTNLDEAGSIGAITNSTDATRGTTALQQGDTLTAGTITDPDGAVSGVSYQWKADSVNVGTGTSYTLRQADVGKAITVTATYTDPQGGGKTVTSSPTSNVVNVNDAPTVSAPGTFTVSEETAGNLQYTGTPFADVDNTSLTVTLSILDGTINATTGGNVTVGGTAIARTFSGTAADLNTFFKTAGKITYTGAQDVNGTRTLTTKVDDGSASNNTATTLSTITISAVNDAPTVSAPSTFTVSEETAGNLVYTGTPFADVDSTNLTVTLSIADGSINATDGDNVTVGGTDIARTFTGTAADLNTFFTTAGKITYTGALNANGTRTLTTKVDDGSASNNTATTTSTITITEVNDAPTLSAPSTFTVSEDTPGNLVYTGTPFADVDSTNLTVTLSIGDGSINATTGGNVTVGGTAIARTFSGTAADLNTFFTTAGKITYTGALNNNVTRTFRTAVDDGSASNNIATTLSAIAISAVNDAPTVTAPGTFTVSEETAGNLVYTGTPFADVDSTNLTVTLSIADGVINVTSSGNVTVAGTAIARTFSGTAADLNAFFTTAGKITYTGAQDVNGTRTLTTKVDDGSATNSTATTTSTITIDGENDAPTITTPAGTPLGANSNVAYSIAGGFTIADVDAGSSPVQVSFQVLEGAATDGDVLDYGTLPSGVTLVGNNFGTNHVYTFQGTISALNSWMATTGFLKFTSTSAIDVVAKIKTTVNDQGNTGTGSTLTANGTYISVNVVSDATPPVFQNAVTNTAGDLITLTYNEALSATTAGTGAFAVSVGGTSRTVNNVSVTGSTVVLTLASAVTNGQTVTVGYTDPTVSNDTNAVQDSAGNDAITLAPTVVTNNVPDTTPPVFQGAATDNTGKIVLTYNEALSSMASGTSAFYVYLNGGSVRNSVTGVAVSGSTVVLTLTTPIVYGNTATVQYVDSDVMNTVYATQDLAGNDAVTMGSAANVVNNMPDTTPPVFQNAVTNTAGDKITLTYNEALAAATAGTGAFAVSVGGSARNVTGVSVSGSTVVLTLASAVANGDTVTVGYTDPSGSNDTNAIQDILGNDAVTLSASTIVTNNVPDTTGPVLTEPVMDFSNGGIQLRFNELLDSTAALNVVNNITITTDGTLQTGAGTIFANYSNDILALRHPKIAGNFYTNYQNVKISYSDPSAANDTVKVLQDALGNDTASFNIFLDRVAYYGSTVTGANITDYIMGGNNDDTIIGGQGNDTMWGYQNFDISDATSDNDVFKWNLGDAGASGATDTIKDFTKWNGMTGDKLSIYGLLSGFTPASSRLEDWVKTVATGQTVNGVFNSTVMTIDVDGPGSSAVTQVIQFEGINLLSGVSGTLAQQLASLKTSGVFTV